MRKIIKHGVPVKRFKCMVCGQEELLTQGEPEVCQNCGCSFEEKPTPKQLEETKINDSGGGKLIKPLWKDLGDKPRQQMKAGRKPLSWDEYAEICTNCRKALKAEKGYTCGESCEHVNSNDSCNLFSLGVPVGGR